jgi:transposase
VRNELEKAGMFSVELYGRVRHACHVEGLSQREAARRFGIHRNTVRKMLAFSVPPGYRRTKPPLRPKLDAFTTIIDAILKADRTAPPKQRHTAKRIHERLRAEHGFAGGYTIVKDDVHERRARTREVFVPLAHPPGHAQVDFGEAVAVIGGVQQKIHFFCLDLPHSDAGFVKAYPAERTEAFLDGHNAAFAFLGGVPQSILYDNTALAVARILGDGTRQRTRSFAELQSHYLFRDRFGRPGKGNDKGKVEGLVGYARRNFLVPIPAVASFAELNAHLEQRCLERLDHRLRGHAESIGERLMRDLAALQARPAMPYEACERKAARVSSLSLVRYDRNDYSVPTAYGHRAVLVRGYVDEVVIACGAEIIARHPRSYAREDFVFDPLHYLALLEEKVGALDQAAPLQGWALPEAFTTLRRLLEARMGKPGKREYVQVLRRIETFQLEDVHAAVREALRLGVIGFDAVKHLVLCRIERRPPKLDLTVYPYLPRVTVATTSAKAYLSLLGGTAA